MRIDKSFPFAADMIQITILYGKGITFMKEYEVFVETINPCGGSRHAQSEFIDVEAESPEAYVKNTADSRLWILLKISREML